MYKVPEAHRITRHKANEMVHVMGAPVEAARNWINDHRMGLSGFFILPNMNGKGMKYLVFASNVDGWEHVTVSLPLENRCPTWEEMCWVKSIFWDAEDCVVQFHPPTKKPYNKNEFTLHLWRKKNENFDCPPSML